MKEEAYSILKIAIANHRDLLLGSKSSCLGILKDYGGREHPEVGLLSEAIEENIPDRLMRSQPVTQEVIDSLVDQFSSKRFYARDISSFVVSSWADALGLFELKQFVFTNSEEPSATSLDEREWHYIDGNATIGPITESHLKSLARTGQINANNVVWSPGMSGWEPASKYFLEASQPMRAAISSPPPLPTQVQPAPISKQPTQVKSSTSKHNTISVSQYGGIRRLQYLGICFGIFVANVIVIALMSAGGKSDTIGSGVSVLFAFVYVFPTFYRLKNTGSNPWWSVASIIPFIGFFISIRCLIYQEGYEATKKLDTAGKTVSWIIAGVFILVILCIILAALAK